MAIRVAPALVAGVWLMSIGAQLVANQADTWRFGTPVQVFWFIVVATGLCGVLAAAVLVRAWRSGTAETALFGSFLVAASVLPFVHGLLVPGVLYGPNDATLVAIMLAVPVASVALAPWLAPNNHWSNTVVRRWRIFVAGHLLGVLSLCGLLLSAPGLLPLPGPGSLSRALFIAIAVSACALASWRQVSLTIISGRPALLGVAIGLAFIGSAPLMLVGAEPFGAGFWLAHGLDTVGILFAGGLALVHYRRNGTMRELLEPLEVASPLRALEVGLDPLVHRFVADLDEKDPATRDHVVRTARFAVRMAVALHLSPVMVRNVGVAAMLHDVGKLEIPDEILLKPGLLDDAELEVMRSHAAVGAGLVGRSAALADAAPLVRSHHERWDGRGYPDGLAGEEIPLGARIVSVCDSFDAMSQTRVYRKGMDLEDVRAVMATNSGSQWDEYLVTLLWRMLDGDVQQVDDTVFDAVGRPVTDEPPSVLACCVDATPEQTQSLSRPSR